MSHDFRDRVWFTAHIRMRTERRLRLMSRILNCLTVWYSTVLTCLTVYQLIASNNPVRDVASAALAIVLLALSIFVPSLNLEQQADRFRECYLKLQRLLDTVTDDTILNISYYDILDAYPNHPPMDYTDFIVSSKLAGQNLTTSGKPVLPTIFMFASYWFRRFFGLIITVVAVVSPGLLYYLR
jgi:hypothetical protein